MLDASKAFDRIEYCNFFKLSLRKNVSPLIMQLLIHMYINQQFQVKWGNVILHRYETINGVKQAGVLSAIFFPFRWISCYSD